MRGMKQGKVITLLHWLGYALMFVFIIIGFVKAREGQEAFMEYLKEDGLVENLTTLFLLASCGIAVYRAIAACREGKKLWSVTWSVLAFLFFFAAGEEISWGQRIFNIASSDYFLEKNLQQEINLHNLVVGGIKLNKLIFSQILTAVLAFYILFLRILAQKTRFFNKAVRQFGIPLPRWEHVVALLTGTVLVSQYHLLKAGELREFVFAVVFFLIFLRPYFVAPLPKGSDS